VERNPKTEEGQGTMTNKAARHPTANPVPPDAAAIAPVRKSIRVRASQSRAFEVFTEGLDRWWPRKASIGTAQMKSVAIEPRLGGRWYETGIDGSQCDIGRVLIWDPPHRFVTSWDLNSHWRPDPDVGSEVEVRFIAEGPGVTLVELEHRKFERMGAEGGAAVRWKVDNGWPGMLARFQEAVES
jgi:uncharacterized protein YndB with AHSA1/START domain